MEHHFKTLFFPIRWVCSCGATFKPVVSGNLAHDAGVARDLHNVHLEEVAEQG
jgi:hypothetical protein